jgi:hypothetical protein
MRQNYFQYCKPPGATRPGHRQLCTNRLLKPESDIVMQLVEELKKHSQLQRHYVKGHQDIVKEKKQDYTQAERYNIAANNLATVVMRH